MEEQQVVTEEVEEQAPGDLEQEQPEVQETAPAEEAPPSEEDDFTDFEPEKKGRVEKRIKQLLGRAKAAEEARRKLEDDLAELSEDRDGWRSETLRLASTDAKPGEMPKVEVDASDLPEPRYDDFDTDAEYNAALVRRATILAMREEEARRAAIAQRREQEQRLDTIRQWRQMGASKYADFGNVFHEAVPVTEEMGQFILNHENGHDIAYYLGSNPGEANRIAGMHPVQQKMEMRQVARKAMRTKPKTMTTAPTPTSPVGDREVVGKTLDISDPNISFKDYEKIRMKQLRDRASGV